MIGPRSDRDLFLTGNITFDLRRPGLRTTPFLVAGTGLFRHMNSFGGRPFSASKWRDGGRRCPDLAE